MVPDQPERKGRLHDQLLELESVRSAGLLTAAEHKSKREAVISRWEESQARLETTLAENKAKTEQLLHALRATVKHGSDLLSTKQMEGVRQAYLELTGLSSLPSAVPKLSRAGPSGTKRRADYALDIDQETWGSLPDKPLDDLEDSGALAPAPVTPDEVPPAPMEEEEPQEPEEKARRATFRPLDAREVKEMFRGVGTVTEAVVHQDGSPKARATFRVTFAESSQAERAVRTMHGRQVEGIGKIRVEMLAQAKRKAKEDKPKRAKNSYLLFSDHMRDRVKEDLTADLAEGEKLTARATMIAIAALWREQNKETKEEWQALWREQDKETKEEWQARAKELRAAVDQTPERAAVEVGPSTSQDAKAVEVDRPGPSKRPRHEGEGEAITRELVEVHRHMTHAEYYARVADLYHSNKNAAGYENVQLKLES